MSSHSVGGHISFVESCVSRTTITVLSCNENGRVLHFGTEFQYYCFFFRYSVHLMDAEGYIHGYILILRVAGVFGGISLKIRHLRSVQGVAARLLMTSSAGDGYRCGLLWCCCWVASLACHADEVSNRWWDGRSRARGAMENCNENVYDDSTKQSSSISHFPARMPSRSRSNKIQSEGATTRPARDIRECLTDWQRGQRVMSAPAPVSLDHSRTTPASSTRKSPSTLRAKATM
jgi:hypothetical protein